MKPEILAAIIAGIVSFVTAILSLMIARIQTARALQGAFATKLQELRLHHYPKAFELTERLGKKLNDSDDTLPSIFNEIGKDLSKWKAGIPALIMSQSSIQGYYQIKEALKTKLAKGDRYSGEQIIKIRNARECFRSGLRADIGLQKEIRKSYPDWVALHLNKKINEERK